MSKTDGINMNVDKNTTWFPTHENIIEWPPSARDRASKAAMVAASDAKPEPIRRPGGYATRDASEDGAPRTLGGEAAMMKMNRIKLSFALTALLALGSTQAKASVTVLTFEGLQNLESVNDFYNGGLGGNGSGPGTNYGVTFSSNSLALISDQAGGNGNFDADQLPSPVTGLFFLSGGAATMNVAAGFDTGFSFYYSAINFSGAITVYDGLNGTGNVLATLNLPVTPADPAGRFQPFAPIGVTFAGTARSVDFGGTVNQIVFDNITLGSGTPGTVPEPSTLVLGAIGLAGLVGLSRRRRACAA
jgi:hypothetical protein